MTIRKRRILENVERKSFRISYEIRNISKRMGDVHIVKLNALPKIAKKLKIKYEDELDKQPLAGH